MKITDKIKVIAIVLLLSILISIVYWMGADKDVKPHSCSFCEHNVSEGE